MQEATSCLFECVANDERRIGALVLVIRMHYDLSARLGPKPVGSKTTPRRPPIITLKRVRCRRPILS